MGTCAHTIVILPGAVFHYRMGVPAIMSAKINEQQKEADLSPSFEEKALIKIRPETPVTRGQLGIKLTRQVVL